MFTWSFGPLTTGILVLLKEDALWGPGVRHLGLELRPRLTVDDNRLRSMA